MLTHVSRGIDSILTESEAGLTDRTSMVSVCGKVWARAASSSSPTRTILTGSLPFQGVAPVWVWIKNAVTLRDSVGESAMSSVETISSAKKAATRAKARTMAPRTVMAVGPPSLLKTWYELAGRALCVTDMGWATGNAFPSSLKLRRLLHVYNCGHPYLP